MLDVVEHFEQMGHWWLPGETREDRRAGTLRFGTESVLLSVTPSFSDAWTRDSRVYPVILGQLNSGRIVTLVNGLMTNLHMVTDPLAGGQLETEEVIVGGILQGAHLEEGLTARATGVQMSFDALPQWAFPGANLSSHSEVVNEEGMTSTVLLSFPRAVTVPLERATLEISYSPRFRMEQDRFEGTRRVSIYVGFSDPLQLDEATQSFVMPIQQFLTFASSRPARGTFLSFARADDEGMAPGPGVEFADIDWFERPGGASTRPMMLLPIARIGNRLNEVLARWFATRTDADSAFNLYWTVAMERQMPFETRFLLAIQALEVLHRRCFPAPTTISTVDDPRIQVIQAALDDRPAIQDWAVRRLQRRRAVTLRDRLEAVVDATGSTVQQALPPNFIRAAVKTRNWLTHYDPNARDEAAQGEDLYRLTEWTLALFECSVLGLLGFEAAEVDTLFSGSPRSFIMHFAPAP